VRGAHYKIEQTLVRLALFRQTNQLPQMKGPVFSSLLLLIGLSSQLPAIERPKALDDIRPNERASRSQVQEQGQGGAQVQKRLLGQAGDLEPEAIPQVKQAPRAWLGVLSKPIDETLGVHLGLESGVVLDYVAPDSPAAASGLLQHDIVVKVDGEPVGDQDELREAIQSHDLGAEVTLTVVSKGEEVERKVKLGERPAAVPQLPRGRGPARAEGGVELPGDLKFENLENLPELKGLKDFRGGADLQKQLEGHMKRLEKQLRDMNRRGGAGMKLDFDLFKDLQKPQKGEAFNFNFKSSSSFKFVDDEGSVEMKTTDGGKEVVVRDLEGEILFEGPWDNEQDKASAPQDIRERVEGMNKGKLFRFRLENLPNPDLEIPEEAEPELE